MESVHCPSCKSQKIWKDGLRQTRHGDIQRYICRDCGYRFSETSVANPESGQSNRSYRSTGYTIGRQICVLKPTGAKNLAEVETRQKRAAGATKQSKEEIKGKIIEFAWKMKNEGYKESTIKVRSRYLRQLVRLGADLMDPESVKETIADRESWCETTKATVTGAYKLFTTIFNIPFTPPKYKMRHKLPFIPLEREIYELIAGCGKKTATFIRLLKETGMRSGEAWKLEWIDLDTKRNTITVNKPEKYSNPRRLKISEELVCMLNRLPKDSKRIFGDCNLRGFRSSFSQQRKRIARKLDNPRIQQISFHTLRHWKATMEYHKTKDILHVQKMLGHRSINSTLLYTQLVHFEGSEFTCKVAETLDEAKELVEAGFQYVTEMEEKKIFRKRK